MRRSDAAQETVFKEKKIVVFPSPSGRLGRRSLAAFPPGLPLPA